jgi:hypothetical protein
MLVGVRCKEGPCKVARMGSSVRWHAFSNFRIGDERVRSVIAELTLHFWPTSLHNPAPETQSVHLENRSLPITFALTDTRTSQHLHFLRGERDAVRVIDV